VFVSLTVLSSGRCNLEWKLSSWELLVT